MDIKVTTLMIETLRTVDTDGDILGLINQGYQYSQIANVLRVMGEMNFIEFKNDTLKVTKSGV